MEVGSRTYECWHEMGHAFVCLALGGDVNYVELLEVHKTGRARARCVTNPDIRQAVACGGFAAEFVLLRDGDLGSQDEREITQTIFRNAAIDREMYFSVYPNTELSQTQDQEFMDCAVYEVAPMIQRYKDKIAVAVRELEADGCVSGERIKHIMDGT